MSNRRRTNRSNVIKGRFGQPPNSVGPSGSARPIAEEEDGRDQFDRDLEEAELAVARALALCAGDGRMAGIWTARCLLELARPDLARDTLRKLLNRTIDNIRQAGWLPGDLVQVVRRKIDGDSVPFLCAALRRHAERFGVTGAPAGWVQGLTSLPGDPWPGDLPIEEMLALAAVLRTLPRIATVHAAPSLVDSDASKHLARVRALLAKAESTTFEEEADALVAKAQELISKHSLDAALASTDARAGSAVGARRIWLDAPYLEPKGVLVHTVAEANRCRSVFSPAFGFITLIGAAADLEAVDLLVTSLLTQAEAAMRRPRPSTVGPKRTTSFRRAFLLSFATRIGQRLREATTYVQEHTQGADRLLPVLADREAQVEARMAELFPESTTGRSISASNLNGWYAGRAAADLARLGNRGELDD
jgi:hypothetical protein